jgi:hypothetical protein
MFRYSFEVIWFSLHSQPLQDVSYGQGRVVFDGQIVGNIDNCSLIVFLVLLWNFNVHFVREIRPGVLKFRANLDFANHLIINDGDMVSVAIHTIIRNIRQDVYRPISGWFRIFYKVF